MLIEIPILDSFADAVRTGLSRRPRSIPPRFFYDTRGSELFEKICALPEYYVTRTETQILQDHQRELPSARTVVEFGCGYGLKTEILLNGATTYVPIDISQKALEETERALTKRHRGLAVKSIRAEFDRAFELIPRDRSLVLFLGSNIGNFNHAEAVRFLSALRGHDVLVGFDMQKDRAVLHAAYNDAQGVTAEFNLNVLARINRELGGTFDLKGFEHRAFYNERESRIEMHLVSRRAQEARIEAIDTPFRFDAGETVHTENSYKFSDEQIGAIATESGFRVARTWTDERRWFAVVLLT